VNVDDLIRVEGSRTLAIGEAKVRVADDGEGRIVYGRIVPYNRVATVNDGAGPYQEMFAPGSFSRSIQQRTHKIKLLVNHDRTQLPIGRALTITDDPEGPLGEFLVSKRHLGLVEDVKDEILDSFSIRFRGIHGKRTDGVVVRTEAALGDEVSIVGFPAYVDAAIGGVRSDIPAEVRQYLDRYFSDLLALADPGTGTPAPPTRHGQAAVRAAQLRSLDLIIQDLKG
jgi:HK97 family phage prohead protease